MRTNYTLHDIYVKSFFDGGMTVQQFWILMCELQGIQNEEFEFQVTLHGGKIKKSKQRSIDENIRADVPLFGDPDDYDKMSEAERTVLTQRMVTKHKHFMNTRGK